jgi:SAM-dependent methyltransferase
VSQGERGAEYWNAVITGRTARRPAATWRAHADRVNADLCRAFWPSTRPGRILKTDLFDEASGTGLLPVLAGACGAVYGIDHAENTAALGRARHPAVRATVADVRVLPFASGVFDLVISNSTLDHFENRGDIARSLRELTRVLRPGGRLILTLDNPANPVVVLRNSLPFAWLSRLRLVPYYVGKTAGAGEGRRLLAAAGLRQVAVGAALHCPRAPAVGLASLLDRVAWSWPRRALLALLGGFERLGRLPTRYLTGYYVTFVADKIKENTDVGVGRKVSV